MRNDFELRWGKLLDECFDDDIVVQKVGLTHICVRDMVNDAMVLIHSGFYNFQQPDVPLYRYSIFFGEEYKKIDPFTERGTPMTNEVTFEKLFNDLLRYGVI